MATERKFRIREDAVDRYFYPQQSDDGDKWEYFGGGWNLTIEAFTSLEEAQRFLDVKTGKIKDTYHPYP